MPSSTTASGEAATRWLGLALAAVVAGGLVALGTRSGVGLSPDSVAYLSAARDLMGRKGLTLWTGDPLVDWPPLYPLLLAALGVVGVELSTAARVLAAVAHGATVLIGACWLQARCRSTRIAGTGALALVVAPALLWPALWAWSEAPFTALSLVCLVALDRYGRSTDPRALLLAGGFAAAAAVTRYAGVAIVATGVLFLLWTGRPRRDRGLGAATVFAAVAAAPLAAWLIRNQVLTGTLMGQRAPDRWGVGYMVGRALAYVSTWILPLTSQAAWLTVAWAALVALIAGSVRMGWTAVRSSGRATSGGPGRREGASGGGLMALFVGVYVIFIVWSASTTALDLLNERLLAPAFAPLALALTVAADRAVAAAGGRRPALLWTLAGAYGLWLLLSAPLSVGILRAGAAGQGYRSAEWRDAEIVRYLKRASLSGMVLSNDAPGVYLETGLPARWGPRRHVYASPQTIPDDVTPLLEERARGTAITLVWFDRAPPYFMSGDEVARALDADTAAALTGGVLLTMR